MPDYETQLRERIRKMTRPEAFKLLKEMEFNTKMKDVWSMEDFERMDVIDKLLKEIRDA